MTVDLYLLFGVRDQKWRGKPMRQDDTNVEIPVSVDAEFTGPIPGVYSMISLGAVAYQYDGAEISRFKVNLKELPDAKRDERTMKWWTQFPDAWELATKDPVDVQEGMQKFSVWLAELPGAPKLVGWPLPVDFMFVYWYYIKYVDLEPPFSYDGIDVKTMAMTAMKNSSLSATNRDSARRAVGIQETEFNHDPVDDAIEQARIFFAIRKLAGIE